MMAIKELDLKCSMQLSTVSALPRPESTASLLRWSTVILIDLSSAVPDHHRLLCQGICPSSGLIVVPPANTHRLMSSAVTSRCLNGPTTLVDTPFRSPNLTTRSDQTIHRLPSKNCVNSSANKHLPSSNSASTPNFHSPFRINIPKIHISSKISLAPSALKYSTCLPSALRIARCELSL